MNKNSIEYQYSFMQERPSGRLYLPTIRYKKIANLLRYDYDNFNENQRMIFKSLCLDKRINEETNLERFGIYKTL